MPAIENNSCSNEALHQFGYFQRNSNCLNAQLYKDGTQTNRIFVLLRATLLGYSLGRYMKFLLRVFAPFARPLVHFSILFFYTNLSFNAMCILLTYNSPFFFFSLICCFSCCYPLFFHAVCVSCDFFLLSTCFILINETKYSLTF